MMTAQGLEVGPWRPGDEISICRLFQQTFGRRRTVEQWRWQFLGQGIEPHIMLARDGRGDVVAHFGGVPRRVLLDGRETMFTVAVDSMVSLERRAGLKRRGLFATVVQHWVDHFCERGPVQVGYGLANREAFRIGSRLLGYTRTSTASLLARHAETDAGMDVVVEKGDWPADDHDEFWLRCARRFDVVACRDIRYLQWRYCARPDARYRFLLIRRRGSLAAVGVFHPEYPAGSAATLVDLIWDGRDPHDVEACARAGEALAAEHGKPYLAALLPAGSSEASILRRIGYDDVALDLTLVARSFRTSVYLGRIDRGFFFTCGDFDLV